MAKHNQQKTLGTLTDFQTAPLAQDREILKQGVPLKNVKT